MNNLTVFAVDDEEVVLELYELILGKHRDRNLSFFEALDDGAEASGFDLHTFPDGEQYLDALKAHYGQGGRVPLSILDMRLPGKHGLEIAKEARDIDPDMTIVIATAYSDYSVRELIDEIDQNIFYFRKPFNNDELYVLVDSSLKSWNDKANRSDLAREVAIDATTDGLWDWNVKTGKVYFSTQWKKMLGYSDEEIGNDVEEWKKRVHPDDLERTLSDVGAHLGGETEYYVNEHRMQGKDGNYIWILDRGKAQFDANGEAYRMTGFHTDITERKRLEEELRSMGRMLNKELQDNLSTQMKLKHTNAELERKLSEEIRVRKEKEEMLLQHTRQAAMGEMISMIAHQWRQPITAIGLSAENALLDIALGDVNLEELKEGLEMTTRQVAFLSQTIDDFRDFFVPNKTKDDVLVSECIDGALSLIEKSLTNHGVEVIREYHDTTRIKLYKNEIVQVFLNLLKNAQDVFNATATENAKITIRTLEDDKEITVRLCDNGGGIPDTIIGRIFDPYFTTKNEYNGTGLGLYMSQTIITEHACGMLRATNEDGGACFTIKLPFDCSGR